MLTILSIVLVVVVFVTPHLLIVDTFDSMFPRAVEAGNFYTIWRGMAFFPLDEKSGGVPPLLLAAAIS